MTVPSLTATAEKFYFTNSAKTVMSWAICIIQQIRLRGPMPLSVFGKDLDRIHNGVIDDGLKG
jgi:hypothetical protein